MHLLRGPADIARFEPRKLEKIVDEAETFLIDRSGRIVDRIIGRVDADRLAGAVEPLLKGGTE